MLHFMFGMSRTERPMEHHVAPHRRCRFFVHVWRETPDVTPCHTSPPQGVTPFPQSLLLRTAQDSARQTCCTQLCSQRLAEYGWKPYRDLLAPKQTVTGFSLLICVETQRGTVSSNSRFRTVLLQTVSSQPLMQPTRPLRPAQRMYAAGDRAARLNNDRNMFVSIKHSIVVVISIMNTTFVALSGRSKEAKHRMGHRECCPFAPLAFALRVQRQYVYTVYCKFEVRLQA